jgi:hypothetical protein
MAAPKDRTTDQIAAIDLSRLARSTEPRDQPTQPLQRMELLALLTPFAPRANAHVVCAPTAEADIFEVETRPVFHLICTPPEVRAAWLRECWARRAAIASLLVALFVFVYLLI